MEKLIVSSSPHFRSGISTKRIMLDVVIALLPACIAATVIFGPICLAIMALSITSAVLTEFVCRKVLKRPQTIGDLSAVVTGLILALNMPATAPSLWMAPLASAIAIAVVKQCFGGLGQNFVNPAMTGRIVVMMSFTTQMSTWPSPLQWLGNADAVTHPTPMALTESSSVQINLVDMLLGIRGGSLGETCAIALILGGLYLCLRKVIKPIIPVTFCATTAICCWLFSGFETGIVLSLLSGGLLLGAIFMATDYVTAPVTNLGKFIFALGCGLITAVIRTFGVLPEGVSFAIIIMNILTPHIDRLVTSKPFGAVKAKKEG